MYGFQERGRVYKYEIKVRRISTISAVYLWSGVGKIFANQLLKTFAIISDSIIFTFDSNHHDDR